MYVFSLLEWYFGQIWPEPRVHTESGMSAAQRAGSVSCTMMLGLGRQKNPEKVSDCFLWMSKELFPLSLELREGVASFSFFLPIPRVPELLSVPVSWHTWNILCTSGSRSGSVRFSVGTVLCLQERSSSAGEAWWNVSTRENCFVPRWSSRSMLSVTWGSRRKGDDGSLCPRLAWWRCSRLFCVSGPARSPALLPEALLGTCSRSRGSASEPRAVRLVPVSVKVVFAWGLKNSPFRINGHPSGCWVFFL